MRILVIRPVFREDDNKIISVLCKGGPYCSVGKMWKGIAVETGQAAGHHMSPGQREWSMSQPGDVDKKVGGFETHPEVESVVPAGPA